MKSKIVAAMMAVMLSVSIVGCSSSSGGSNSSQGKNSDTNVESTTQDETSYQMTISTKYGDLYYPDQWEEYLKTSQEEKDESLIVNFNASINDETYSLFTVMIDSDEGTSVGEITDADGKKHSVSIEMEEIENIDDLTDTEQQRIYAMQEDLNYVIDYLK